MEEDIIRAAKSYLARGWVPIALGPDQDGRPKKPIAHGWQKLTLHSPKVRQQGWEKAIGVGILCGEASGNMAVIDIDDDGLAAAVFARLARSHKPFRWVWTIRGRGHLYVKEEESGPGMFRLVRFEGRDVNIELRRNGQQVAAPPTPGYVLAREEEPTACRSVIEVFEAMCRSFGLEPLERAGERSGGPGYPSPWQETVPEGQRNNALFVEAARLADAGMPFREALELLLLRCEKSYDQATPFPRREIEATVRSAYRHANRLSGRRGRFPPIVTGKVELPE